jgi:hypothetical protein
MRKDEYIICSAIWFDDGIDHEDMTIGGKTGFVICGRRHHNCFHTDSILDPKRKYIKFEKEQGFVTNKNRFVDRNEAVDIAFDAGQTYERTPHSMGLFSEDLW